MTIAKLIKKVTDRFDLWSVWSDFIEATAIAISNRIGVAGIDWDAREQRYLDLMRRYNADEKQRLAELFGKLVLEFSDDANGDGIHFDDVLGRTFMELELGSKWHGQFFTPFHLCRVMAKLTAGDAQQTLEARPFITVSDPCVGGGAMPIALCAELHEAGVDYQHRVHVTAQDIDLRSVHMAYVQLSLINVPAVVILGDTLRMENRSEWYTPAHVMGGWSMKLRTREHVSANPVAHEENQLSLF